jgi:hypothetical protein
VILLGISIKSLSGSIWSNGIGSINVSNIIRLPRLSVTGAVLIANSPQLIVSFLYVMYNNLFTCMLSAAELSDFVKHPKALRVSEPAAMQRSTYWLSLPYRYALPLMGAMSVLHWFISQSIFLALITVYDAEGIEDPGLDISACGWSPLGLLLSILWGGMLILALFGFGFKKFTVGMPVISNCSIALSAACHPLSSDFAVSKLPIRYGVLEESSIDGHEKVGFGTSVIRPLEDQQCITSPVADGYDALLQPPKNA